MRSTAMSSRHVRPRTSVSSPDVSPLLPICSTGIERISLNFILPISISISAVAVLLFNTAMHHVCFVAHVCKVESAEERRE